MSQPNQRSKWLLPFYLWLDAHKAAYRRYKLLNLKGKLAVWCLLLFYIALGATFFVIGPSNIAQFFYDLAQDLSNLKYGWLILGAAIILICFPPLIGHTTAVTLCGFAYGMKGFYLAAAASLIGSALAFVTLRFLFAKRLRAWTSKNEKWTALDTVIRAKGLLLIILIRISPIPPWVYSTSLFASIESVKLWQFVVATMFVFPKLLLNVFVGSRLASLSDGGQRHEMDTKTKIINSCLVGGGVVIGIITSIFVYHSVQSHLRHMKGLPAEVDELAAEAIEESAPLLNNFSSDSVDDVSEERDNRV